MLRSFLVCTTCLILFSSCNQKSESTDSVQETTAVAVKHSNTENTLTKPATAPIAPAVRREVVLIDNSKPPDPSWWKNLNHDWRQRLDRKMAPDASQEEVTKLYEAVTTIIMPGQGIEDLSPIMVLGKIKDLNVAGNQIGNLDVVGNFRDLRTLQGKNIGVSDVLGLEGLKNLQTIKLSFNEITNIAPIENLKLVRELVLNDNQITNIRPVRNYGVMTKLNLSGNPITDLSPLSTRIALDYLYIANTKVTDLSPLHNLSGLLELSIENTGIRSLAPLNKCKELRKLVCSGSAVPKEEVERFKALYPKCEVVN